MRDISLSKEKEPSGVSDEGANEIHAMKHNLNAQYRCTFCNYLAKEEQTLAIHKSTEHKSRHDCQQWGFASDDEEGEVANESSDSDMEDIKGRLSPEEMNIANNDQVRIETDNNKMNE